MYILYCYRTRIIPNVIPVSQQRKVANEECQMIANWLTTIDDGEKQSNCIEQRKEGTSRWLLDSAEYQVWLEPSKQTLLCHGMPGAGKTIATATVIADLRESFKKDAAVGLAYVYCDFKTHHELKDLLSSLLKQLVLGQEATPDVVKSLYNKHNTGGTRTRPSSQDIIDTLLLVAPIYSRVFIIVDALDECHTADECRLRFISEILKLQTKTGANLFVTSRYIDDIVDSFKGAISLEIRASNEDVLKYLDDRISHSSNVLKECGEQIKMEITKAVSGMYVCFHSVLIQ